MAQKQKATGIITLLLFKKISSPFAIGLRTGIIYRPQTQTNKFLNFVCLFVIEMSSFSDFCQENNKNCKFQTNMAN